MKRQTFLLMLITLFVLVACKNEKQQEVYNPFATPEGCVKEYIKAVDSCNLAKMLSCYSYDPKYERIVREGLQKVLDDKARDKNYRGEGYHEKTDSVVLTEIYPNTAVVTVYFTYGYTPEKNTSWFYKHNLVKDGNNWKLEAQLSYTITAE